MQGTVNKVLSLDNGEIKGLIQKWPSIFSLYSRNFVNDEPCLPVTDLKYD